MKLSPQRSALVAIVAVLLVGGAAWWFWQRQARPLAEPGVTQGVASLPRQAARTREPGREAEGLQLLADLQAAEAAMAPCEADMMALRKARLGRLARNPGVDARLTHALMTTITGDPQETSRSLADLAKSAPGNPDVAWYQAMYCKASLSDCDREAAIDRYVALEPENMGGWLMALEAADDQDERTRQALLERAADAHFHDARTGDSFIRLYEAMHDLPLPESCHPAGAARLWRMFMTSAAPPTAADMAAMGAMAVVSAEALPYRRILEMCQPSGSPLPVERADACKRVLARLADDGTLLGQSLGTRLMVDLTADSAEGPHWRERHRQHNWMWNSMSQDIRFDHDTMMKRMTDGEVATVREALRSRKQWPPPTDWLPDDAHARSLILTGRPPGQK